jgi:hypothetical protein
MRRFFAGFAVLAALITVPTTAGARVIEVGQVATTATPSCPTKPCLAVSRTTGYQAKVGTGRGLMEIPAKGRIVAWTISLGKPGTKQISFFDDKLGGTAQAGIVIMKPGAHLFRRVMGIGPIVHLQPYFGTTVQFPLTTTIPVEKGWVVGLSVPTWAPALAVNLGGDTSWRASRAKGKCDDTQTQTAQLELQSLAQYYCLYRTARLTYSATLITVPVVPTAPKKTTTPKKTR